MALRLRRRLPLLDGKPGAFIIAEAGTNHAHTHYPERRRAAMRYIEAAADCKADAVKFQIFVDNEPLFCPLPGDEARLPRWNDSIIPFDDWRAVREAAERRGLVFLASVFQHGGVRILKDLRLAAVKVASRAAVNFPYGEIAGPFLVSAGMGLPPYAGDHALSLKSFLLQCESKYPSTIRWSKSYFGFSDHSGNPWRAIDAIARGCRIVEVHFHVDERDSGPDRPACLSTDELALVCEARDQLAALRAC